MKKLKNIALFFGIVVSVIGHGQEITRTSIKIDRIKNLIKEAKHDTIKVKHLKKWADIVFLTDYDKDFEIQHRIINLCNDHLKDEKSTNYNWFKEEKWIALDHIGSIYFYDYDNPKEALKYYIPSAEILEELNHLNSSSITYGIIGDIYQDLGDYQEANDFFHHKIKVEEKINSKFALKQLSDSIQLANTNKEMSLTKENEEKQKLLKKEAEKLNTVLEVGIALFILSFIIVFIQWRKTRSQNKIIESQHKLLDESHKEITDSINYAKNIQDALMTSSVYLSDVLPESFIFFRPKDVVSGDYYWVYKTPNNDIYFTVADCTGHGVPGAFMSMIGTSLLNENIIEKKVDNPGEVLGNMREKIIASLNDKNSSKETRDGMDIALCKLNFEKMSLQYAGANNPLIHVRDGEINHIKANYQPVALTIGEKKPFTNHQVELKKGDMIYIYSDGFADQFGGPRGKKYMVTKFRKFLASISTLDIDKQNQLLAEEFDKWKGDQDQIDDVCVMGVRI
jgi:serine phosphatase RsbU (regulator of sigma subunit)